MKAFRAISLSLALALSLGAQAQGQAQRHAPALTTPAPAPVPPAPLETLPPYEPQLLRLAEILGALSYLRTLCGQSDGREWQARMKDLMDAENPNEARRERLAGAFNRGFRGYEVSYRTCTPNAEFAAERFLDEGGRLTRDLSSRYGGG